MKYAGFWIRALAVIIDFVIIDVPILFAFMLAGYQDTMFSDPPNLWIDSIGTVIFGIIYVLFLSSSWQATPGKRVVGIYVIISLRAERPTPGIAFARYCVMVMTMLPLFIFPYVEPAISEPNITDPEIATILGNISAFENLSEAEERKFKEYLEAHPQEKESLEKYAADSVRRGIISLALLVLNLLFCILPVILTKEKKAWHDMVCGTRVMRGRPA